jgi:spore cortex formation protein SpoVR/YcgB (stage V sporulation)
MSKPIDTSDLLFHSSEWNFDTLYRTYDAIKEIALDDLGLDIYPNQLEIISSEQMLDAYSSNGMPLTYQHWSFGKHFVYEEHLYRKGRRGLAYELVINSNPCITYLMEENTMSMQALVTAHASFGHNHFFKNNYLFKQWTDADAILNRPPRTSPMKERARVRERLEYEERAFSDLWRTLPRRKSEDDPQEAERDALERKKTLNLPEENLLYFIEKNSIILEPWQREILRIVRVIAQYFYPQRQTKVMNEGCATFVHYTIMNILFDRGRISEGNMLEILHSHSSVVFQPGFDDPRYSGLNPYALGFSMMQDIERICTQPTAEDRDWFPEFAGNGDWRGTLLDAWANHRDESFLLQYLSPTLMRKMRLFALDDEAKESHYRVASIHNERGYEKIRSTLARSYDIGANQPNIQVVDVDFRGNRHLRLQHTIQNKIILDASAREATLTHVRRLWGYDVSLVGVDANSGKVIYETMTDDLSDD